LPAFRAGAFFSPASFYPLTACWPPFDGNAPYVEELYEPYLSNPTSMPDGATRLSARCA